MEKSLLTHRISYFYMKTQAFDRMKFQVVNASEYSFESMQRDPTHQQKNSELDCTINLLKNLKKNIS